MGTTHPPARGRTAARTAQRPIRVVCPACRAERIAKRVAGAHVRGRPVDLVECPSTDCELVWAIRPGRTLNPVAAPAAA